MTSIFWILGRSGTECEDRNDEGEDREKLMEVPVAVVGNGAESSLRKHRIIMTWRFKGSLKGINL